MRALIVSSTEKVLLEPFSVEEIDPFEIGVLTKKWGGDPKLTPWFLTEAQAIQCDAGFSIPSRWDSFLEEEKGTMNFQVRFVGFLLLQLQKMSFPALLEEDAKLDELLEGMRKWPAIQPNPSYIVPLIAGTKDETWEAARDEIVSLSTAFPRQLLNYQERKEHMETDIEWSARMFKGFNLETCCETLRRFFPEYVVRINLDGSCTTVGGGSDPILAVIVPQVKRTAPGTYFVVRGCGDAAFVKISDQAFMVSARLFAARSFMDLSSDAKGRLRVFQKPDELIAEEWYQRLINPDHMKDWENEEKYTKVADFVHRGWVLTTKASATALMFQMNLVTMILAVVLRNHDLLVRLAQMCASMPPIMLEGFNVRFLFELLRGTQEIVGGPLNIEKTVMQLMKAIRLFVKGDWYGFCKSITIGDDSIRVIGLKVPIEVFLIPEIESPKWIQSGIVVLTIGKKMIFVELHPDGSWQCYQVVAPIARRERALTCMNRLLAYSPSSDDLQKHPLLILKDNAGPEGSQRKEAVACFLRGIMDDQYDTSEIWTGYGIRPDLKEIKKLAGSTRGLEDLEMASGMAPTDRYKQERSVLVNALTECYECESVSLQTQALWTVKACNMLYLTSMMPQNRSSKKCTGYYNVAMSMGTICEREVVRGGGIGRAPVAFVKDLQRKLEASSVNNLKSLVSDRLGLSPLTKLAGYYYQSSKGSGEKLVKSLLKREFRANGEFETYEEMEREVEIRCGWFEGREGKVIGLAALGMEYDSAVFHMAEHSES